MSQHRDTPVSLTTVANAIEAGSLVTALASYGIEARYEGMYTAGFQAEAPGEVNVVVRSHEHAAATEALRKIRESSEDIDWSQVDVGEPDAT